MSANGGCTFLEQAKREITTLQDSGLEIPQEIQELLYGLDLTVKQIAESV